MQDEDLQLVEASPQHAAALVEMAREYVARGAPRERARYGEALADPGAFIRALRDAACGVGLPRGHVAETTYWLVRDARTIVATSSIRHRMTRDLAREGGHIGYNTRPGQRRKGYGRLVCARTLEKAREMDIHRVLITCDDDNVASRKIIEAVGGVFDDTAVSRATGKTKLRYWVMV
jgi:predicted acetyltransferase